MVLTVDKEGAIRPGEDFGAYASEQALRPEYELRLLALGVNIAAHAAAERRRSGAGAAEMTRYALFRAAVDGIDPRGGMPVETATLLIQEGMETFDLALSASKSSEVNNE